MLVSSIAKFNAVNVTRNLVKESMDANNVRINSTTTNTFGGENDLTMLNSMDKNLSLDLLTNRFVQRLSSLQEKLATKRENNSKKATLNYIA